MSASNDRGELTLDLGGKERVMRFRLAEVVLLEETLGANPLQFLATGQTTRFVRDAIFCGLSKMPLAAGEQRASPRTIEAWLDELREDQDLEEIALDILFAIARGKPGAQAKKMVDAISQVWPDRARPSSAG